MSNTKMQLTDYILPAHWASALINNDHSGMSDDDEIELITWYEKVKPGYCIECSEESEFRHTNDAGTLSCDTLVFTFNKL